VRLAPGIPHALILKGEEFMHHSGVTRRENAEVRPSFQGDAKHRTRNLEIPGLVLTHHPGMTALASLAL
jgi:hypothetical protein